MKKFRVIVVISVLVLSLCNTAEPVGPWPQWGGRNGRNMVSGEKGLAESFDPGKKMRKGNEIDPETTRNVKWTRRLGLNQYGNPTIAQNKIFIGTKRYFWILAAGRKAREIDHFRLGTPVYSSAVAANGVLYITSQKHIWAVQKE